MANVPPPRSYQTVFGDMMDKFLSKQGLKGVRTGSPLVSVFDAASTSDVRATQDVINALKAKDLDKVFGRDLDLLGESEDIPRGTESLSSGFVTIGDSTFTKVSTKLYQGLAAPIIGSASLYVVDASTFPASGTVYVSRGSSSYEGPLSYTAKTNVGTYWRLDLGISSHTQKFHNVGDSVILGQGGNRLVGAGSLVQTPQANVSDAVQFQTLYAATVPDGETSVTGVTVVAKKAGVIGNVPPEAINSFVSNPFPGATVVNPSLFSNATSTEDDVTYRARIRAVRASKSKATPLALTTGVVGATSVLENKRIASASLVTRQGFPATLYVDDGTGYEELNEGVPLETLVDLAYGGEEFLKIAQPRPVSKAFALSTLSAPFSLTSGSKLAVKVGGALNEHTFDAVNFRSIGSATAYEVAASITANSSLAFNARTAENGTKVAIFAKADTQEDVEVVATATADTDANQWLGFSTGRVDTMRLYKNDRLLSKDGKKASIASESQSAWTTFTGTQTLVLAVDGTPAVTYSFTDSDFVNQQTGYTTLTSSNSLDSWVTVFNSKIPGITASQTGGKLTMTSNVGADARGSLVISGGTLISGGGMFVTLSSAAASNDYTLNRNTGEVGLTVPAKAGDRITIGSVSTRGFIESATIAPTTLATAAELWFVVDGAAEVVASVTGVITVAEYIPTPPVSWGHRVRVSAGSALFASAKAGDWAILLDSAFSAANRGAWRVAFVDPSGLYFDIEKSVVTAQAGVAAFSGGITLVRTEAQIQKVTVPAATNYTAFTFAAALSAGLVGARAAAYRTTTLRIATNSFGPTGDIALVATNAAGQALLLPTGDAIPNLTSHLAAAEGLKDEFGTPEFIIGTVASSGTTTTLVRGAVNPGITSGSQLVFQRPHPDVDGAGTISRWSSNAGFHTGLSVVAGTALTTRKAALDEFLPADLFYAAAPLAIGPNDDLTVVLDGDAANKRFTVNMFRKLQATSGTYGTTNSFKDKDNALASLAVGFGLTFSFNDFAALMKARAKSHAESGDTTKTILWRYARFGPGGEKAKVKYGYPVAPNQTVSVVTDSQSDGFTNVTVRLPSSAARTGQAVRNTTRVGLMASAPSAGLTTLTYILGFSISSASRTTNVTTLTLDIATPGATAHGYQIGDGIYVTSSSGSFTSGLKIITAIAAATVSYSETAADAGPIASIGTVSPDVGEATLAASTVIVGDIVTVGPATSLPASYQVTMRISSKGNQWFKGRVESSASAVTVPAYSLLTDTSGLTFYPLNAGTSTAAQIATAVNVLAAVTNSACPVSAVAVGLVGVATGVISLSSYDEFSTSPYSYSLTDGINYVLATTPPGTIAGDYSLSFKDAVTASLATNSDWANEEVRVVPLTAMNVVDYLNNSAVSGLFSGSEIVVCERGARPQLASLTVGSTGSVEVQGGSANALSAAIAGSAINIANTYSSCVVPTAQVAGLMGGMWVEVQNANVLPKTVFAAGSSLLSIDTSGNFILDGASTTNAWDYANTAAAAINGFTWQVLKQGKYTCFLWNGAGAAPDLAGIAQGDWVIVSGGTLSTRNTGTFRVVRTDTTAKAFWVENLNVLAEVKTANLLFLKYDSILPGDRLNISTSLWGAGNVGTWVVESIDTTNVKKFKVVVSGGATAAFTGPTALSTSYPLVQLYEGSPTKLTKKIRSISPTASDGSFSDVKFETFQGYSRMSAAAGSLIVPMDKLSFPTTIAAGIDAYSHTIGLIGEANRVLYGDTRDTATYPGLVASGARVNISGPLVKRITLSFAIRLRTGASAKSAIAHVRSAVASVVNKTGTGTPISIDSLIGAARSVNGVAAVTVLSPTYGVGNDQISVQPFEKPLVLSLDDDISVSIVGE